jgi:8-oxo-dGTP diphosphatase
VTDQGVQEGAERFGSGQRGGRALPGSRWRVGGSGSSERFQRRSTTVRAVSTPDTATVETADYAATLPRKRMGAAVLFTDDAGRVLLVEPMYKDYWELPGGAVDADESPYAAACREIEEELGLSRPPGRLLVLDWVPPRPGRTEGLMTVFDGGILTGQELAAIRVPAEELRGWALCTEAQQHQRLSPLLARRAAGALQARRTGSVAYLEHGHPKV